MAIARVFARPLEAAGTGAWSASRKRGPSLSSHPGYQVYWVAILNEIVFHSFRNLSY